MKKSLPVSGTYYKLITVPNGTTFDRYWQEDLPATLVNGISIFDEGTLVGTANTVSKLNFVDQQSLRLQVELYLQSQLHLYQYQHLHHQMQDQEICGGIVMKVN